MESSSTVGECGLIAAVRHKCGCALRQRPSHMSATLATEELLDHHTNLLDETERTSLHGRGSIWGQQVTSA